MEFLLLTGLRFNEGALLTWKDIDPSRHILTIPAQNSKNHHLLVRPITKGVQSILDRRALDQTIIDSPYVFPGKVSIGTGSDGREIHTSPINTTVKLQRTIKELIDLWITPHDTRRVYASAALVVGVPGLVVKRLLNHSRGSDDVTQGYQIVSIDHLRTYSQKIEDHILSKSGAKTEGGLVIDLISR